jgi:hypothetical protein
MKSLFLNLNRGSGCTRSTRRTQGSPLSTVAPAGALLPPPLVHARRPLSDTAEACALLPPPLPHSGHPTRPIIAPSPHDPVQPTACNQKASAEHPREARWVGPRMVKGGECSLKGRLGVSAVRVDHVRRLEALEGPDLPPPTAEEAIVRCTGRPTLTPRHCALTSWWQSLTPRHCALTSWWQSLGGAASLARSCQRPECRLAGGVG